MIPRYAITILSTYTLLTMFRAGHTDNRINTSSNFFFFFLSFSSSFAKWNERRSH
jgi:hypothetical protein